MESIGAREITTERKKMPTYVALLRGINVGGHKKIKMLELRECFIKLGYQNVQTYIQSGNVVFDCSETNEEDVKKRIEEGLKQSFGFDVTAVMRSKAEFKRLVADTFSEEFVYDVFQDVFWHSRLLCEV